MMQRRYLLLSNPDLDRWAADGGYVPPDLEELEQRLQDLSALRAELGNRIDCSEFDILLQYAEGTLTSSRFGDSLGLHRSNGLRRLREALVNVGLTLLADPTFRASVPERFWHLIPEA